MDTPTIQLHLSPSRQYQNLSYQVLRIELTAGDRLTNPGELPKLSIPAHLDTRGGVIISGRAPIWLYSYLVHELHPTAWVACYDPRLGAVVVATHSTQTTIGQVLPINPNDVPPAQHLSPAVMIVGPPDSGKSVLSHSLFQALIPQYPNIYLERANWDGEGNWILETPLTPIQQKEHKLKNKGKPTETFFQVHAQGILNLRRQKDLVLVDVGGRIDPQKDPVLEACSHYLIISSKPEAIAGWHEFCRDRGNLTPLGVIHSTLEDTLEIHQQEPYFEITCGSWQRGKETTIPDIVLKRCRTLIFSR
ncbi:CRISPR-associated ring nuclease Crn3/Csx3 [[Limnothrix rosea] IAM M-220]|uniref:CRISPR-associated ring nuclease Crn3/Csx3 n=1 Tax=[Limnothrix rosea] IAM M-220 TaxID=454133 RepID=UPI00095D0CC7|nr:CRISPR-associated ring nuclease Crn3/Csx3 [[Limnothrix rosea] IAM M-220]OKH18640.1 CRISPR-associated protein Csx3 [[Limnothrix rosea] IAM M-220]